VKRFRRRAHLAALIAALGVSLASVLTPGLPFPRQRLSEFDLALLRLRSAGTHVESGGARLEVIERGGPLEHEVPPEATIEVQAPPQAHLAPAESATPEAQAAAPQAHSATPDPQPAAAAPAFVAEPPRTPAPALGARSFAIIEASCGAFVAGHAEHERLPPASLTKIVTALVVRQRAGMDDMVGVNVSGSRMAAAGSSVMGIEPGMWFSVRDLLHGVMLPSGNDAALALAEHVGGGNVAAFVDMMNQTAQDLGLQNTHFTNPHGLDNSDLYSTAYDIAIAGRAYLQDPALADIADNGSYRAGQLALKNGNRMIASYQGAYGVKIGYTRRAQQTIVVAARQGDRDLIIGLLGSADRYADASRLLDWAFADTSKGCPS
jgi:serine-type D-Ala-D-Ala carboxypeptidase (penicillin-binding protein 5/6)